MKPMTKMPISYDNNLYVIPRFFNSLGIYFRNLSDEEFKKGLNKAKEEWLKWSLKDWITTLEQTCWALFNLYRNFHIARQELQNYKLLLDELKLYLDAIKEKNPALLSLLQFLLETNKTLRDA